MSYKAFVSSTFVDLKEHRARVIDALRKSDIVVGPMEEWTADSREPKQVSVERMRDCDLCILLVAARRGHIPENEVLSITQMEVREASKRGIDVIPFLYDGESAWPPKYYELDKDEELVKWRKELMEHKVVGLFTNDPASIEAPVHNAIARWLQQQSWPEVHKVYLDTLREAHASIRFLGIGQYKDIRGRPIDELFVNPRIAPQHISSDTSPDQWPETAPLTELFAREKRLVLLGDPGSGKSTLVSWMVWNLTREGDNPWKKALGSPTPLVMVVRELSLEGVKSWEDLLAVYFEHWTARLLGRPRYEDDVRALLESGKAMILLDGLDEISNQRVQERLRRAVWEGMDRYEECRWLLTSRVVGYLNYHKETQIEGLEGNGPFVLRAMTRYAALHYMAPFADDQVKQFAQNWFGTRDQSALRASQDADKLFGAIQANPYTLRLARTPNLLTMMALIHRERARLPHGRALLYTDIAQAYLQSIDENRRIERLGFTLRDQKQWLGRIGFEMQRRRDRQEGESESKEILVAGRDVRQWVMTAMRDTGRETNEAAADAFLDEICRRSGLLLPRGEDQFAFTHLSFQEFFAAVFLLPQFMLPLRRLKRSRVQGAGHDDLWAYAAREVWQETLLLLVELMVAEQPDWLEELLFCLFGEDFSDIAPELTTEPTDDQGEHTEDETYRKATLLARLAINPHAGLGEQGLKSEALARCCVLEVRSQKRREDEIRHYTQFQHVTVLSQLLGVLFGADQDELPDVRKSVADALHDANIKALTLFDVPIDDLSLLADLTSVQVLDLAKSRVTDLSPLSGLTNLRMLNLDETPVSDISVLSGLTDLHTLRLRGTQVSDVSGLAGLTELQRLSLQNTQVSDVSGLVGLTGLQRLSLDNTPVSDVSGLAGLTGLQRLSLQNTQVSDVLGLAGLTGLQRLSLQNTPVSDVSGLAGLTGLQRLSLQNTPVSDVSGLAGLTGLQGLSLQNTPVSDVSGLAGLTGLQGLYLQNTQVSDVSGLAGLTGLQGLYLQNTPVSDVSGLVGLTGLQTLNLAHTPVSNVSGLVGLTGLQTLNLAHTQVSDVSGLAGLTELQWLYLQNTQVSKNGVQQLKEALPRCEIAY